MGGGVIMPSGDYLDFALIASGAARIQYRIPSSKIQAISLAIHGLEDSFSEFTPTPDSSMIG